MCVCVWHTNAATQLVYKLLCACVTYADYLQKSADHLSLGARDAKVRLPRHLPLLFLLTCLPIVFPLNEN